jgi:hypothetical protein
MHHLTESTPVRIYSVLLLLLPILLLLLQGAHQVP